MHAVQESADAGPQRRHVVERICHPEPRLKAVLRRLGEAVRHAMIEPLEIGELREVAKRLIGRSVAGQRDAVEAVAADDEPTRAIDDGSGGRIVELRLEGGHRPIRSAPRLPQ